MPGLAQRCLAIGLRLVGIKKAATVHDEFRAKDHSVGQ